MKIYEHPIEPTITVIEIEKSDEKSDFLNQIIDGFDEYGMAYHSASFGEDAQKPVMYIDCREKNIFPDYENDVICALTIGLAGKESEDSYDSLLDSCVSIAEAKGDNDLLERLINKPPEFFDMFRGLKRVA